ncbi:glycosyltransferase [Saccharolobus solfataricus]
MSPICIYGTVFNNVSTVQESVKSVFDPSYNIVIVDNFSKDGTYEKLLELRKDYNLNVYRFRSSRGKGRAYALQQCPDNSVTAYFDLDTRYNENFHKAVNLALNGLLLFGPILSYINVKEEILKRGNWRNLNYGEDIEFLSRQQISITFPLIIGSNEEVRNNGLYIQRERRYSKFWRIRVLKNIIDLYRGLAITPKDLISIYPYTKKYRILLYTLYIMSKIKGQYKNADPNNYVYFLKNAFNTMVDPQIYIKDFNVKETRPAVSSNILSYLQKMTNISIFMIKKYIDII